MITQKYTMRLNPLMQLGQFVHPGNHTDDVTGFISAIEGDLATFTLFSPTEIDLDKFGGVSMASSLTEDEWRIELLRVLDANPTMRAQWIKVAQATYVRNN